MEPIEALYQAVQTRPRPEDVAQIIEDVLPMSAPERVTIRVASRHSLKKTAGEYSSMAADFARPVSAQRQVRVAAEIFHVVPLTSAECLDPKVVEAFVARLGATISKAYGINTHLTKAQRREAGVFKCTRWYNKRYRLLCRMEDKIKRLSWANRKYEFTRVGKSSLATKIPAEAFGANLTTACFVAYLSARMSARSEFTNESQERAFDTIAAMLLRKCELDPGARWDVIAHVTPEKRVLDRLTDDQKGRLLGAWWSLMVDMADMLKTVSVATPFDRKRMVVSRGNDSSTWNQVAGGWNKARENWVSLLHALGMQGLLDDVCPGKVMRLMAADVMSWHSATGGDVHPDTKVWADLPDPWDVVRGAQSCTRDFVEAVCAAHGVEPEKWTGRKPNAKAVEFRPTPELVHGVTVSCPHLAAALRKGGVFSGKALKDVGLPEFEVDYGPDGFATGAHPNGV